MNIRKNISITLSILLAASLAFSACSKDKDDKKEPKNYPIEKPLTSFLLQAGLGQKTENVTNADMGKWGIQFKPTVKGVIKAITIKIPFTVASVPVTLSQSGGTTYNIDIPDVKVNVEKRFELNTPITLEAGSTYTFTFETEHYYKRSRNDGAVPDYPITVGNIDFLTTYLRTIGSGVSPIITTGVYYYGDLGFEFQQTD